MFASLIIYYYYIKQLLNNHNGTLEPNDSTIVYKPEIYSTNERQDFHKVWNRNRSSRFSDETREEEEDEEEELKSETWFELIF